MKVNFYTQNTTRANTKLKSQPNLINEDFGTKTALLTPSQKNKIPNSFFLASFTGTSIAKQTNYIKEIMEQPAVIKNLLDKYFSKAGKILNIELGLTKQEAKKVSGIKIIASGSSKNVAEMAKNFIEEVTETPVDIRYASEYAHQKIVTNPNDFNIFISQSGNTADTYAALVKTTQKGLKTGALTNTPGSKIHTGASAAIEVGAGNELAVAATKSVTAQLINMYAIGLKMAELKGEITPSQIADYSRQLYTIPQNLEIMLNDTKSIKKVAELLKDEKNIYLLGRGTNTGSVMEGALILRETTYSNPTHCPSGEFLHGYIASVDETTPVIQVIQGKIGQENFDLAYNNLKEIITKRNPQKVVIFRDANNLLLNKEPLFKNAQFIDLPSIEEQFSPIYVVARFQQLAHELTKLQGKNPDAPRSLTKAVLNE